MHIVTISESGSDLTTHSLKDALKEISLTETERVPVVFFEDAALNVVDKIFAKHSNMAFVSSNPSATNALFTSFAKHFAKKDAQHRSQAGLILVSAHPSLKASSAPISYDNYLRMLIENNILDPQRIILVATRAWTQEESAFIRSNRIRCFTMRNIQEEGFNEICLSIMEQVRQWPSAYLSINLNALDPAFAPGLSHPEPGGITSRELIHLLHKLSLLKNIQARDLVGFDTVKDTNSQTIKLAARVLAEWS